MRFEFKPLPGTSLDVARPTLQVAIVGPAATPTVLSLLDTGSVHNRFASWVAAAAGIDLSGVAEAVEAAIDLDDPEIAQRLAAVYDRAEELLEEQLGTRSRSRQRSVGDDGSET